MTNRQRIGAALIVGLTLATACGTADNELPPEAQASARTNGFEDFTVCVTPTEADIISVVVGDPPIFRDYEGDFRITEPELYGFTRSFEEDGTQCYSSGFLYDSCELFVSVLTDGSRGDVFNMDVPVEGCDG